MADLLGVTVEELVTLLKKKRARLPFEIGAFVALETTEALLEGPAVVAPADVRLADDGSVSVYAPPSSSSGEDAARSVVAVLAHLLVAAGSGVPPVLLGLVEQGPSDGRWDLTRLRDELEASLVPLNRSAARRVLSRLLREAQRTTRRRGSSAAPAPELVEGEVDADLDALLGFGDDDEPEVPVPEADPSPIDDDIPTRELVAPDPRPHTDSGSFDDETTARRIAVDPEAPLASERAREPAPAAAAEPAADPAPEPRPEPERAPAVEAAPEPTAAPVQAAGVPDLDGFEELGKKKTSLWALVAVLVLLGGTVGAVAVFRPDIVQRFTDGLPQEDPNAQLEAEAAARSTAEAELERRQRQDYGDLVVRATPERAQVLLFVGRGPAVAHNLPQGVAHEFIAIADGREPTRALVPADAEWQATDDGPRYELAMQAGQDEVLFEEVELGATRLPRDVGTPTGELGSVRVLTNPPGAAVYVLIGFAPNVRVRDLPTGQAHELVLFHEGHTPRRMVVGPSDWRETPDGRVAELDVTLDERPRRRRR